MSDDLRNPRNLKAKTRRAVLGEYGAREGDELVEDEEDKEGAIWVYGVFRKSSDAGVINGMAEGGDNSETLRITSLPLCRCCCFCCSW